MPISGFGGDFFDHVLGTAGDMLDGWIQQLPHFPEIQPALPQTWEFDNRMAYAPTEYGGGYDVDPFLGLPSMGASSPGGLDPFAEALQQSINSGRYGAPAGVKTENPKGQAASPAAHGQTTSGSYATAGVPPSGELPDYARKVAQAYGVDPDIFVRQINQESKFDPSARSPAGAAGVAQFMPGTAAQYGVNVNDPYSSLDGAARHMRDLLKKYNGDYRLALAAYNAGPGNVDKYGEGVFSPDFARGETATYVRNILGR